MQKECRHHRTDETARPGRSPQKASTAAALRLAFSRDEAEATPRTASRSASLASWDANPPDRRFDTTHSAPPFPPATPVSSAPHPPQDCLKWQPQNPARVPAPAPSILERGSTSIASSLPYSRS